jgi:hypothetical protein
VCFQGPIVRRMGIILFDQDVWPADRLARLWLFDRLTPTYSATAGEADQLANKVS